MANYKAYSEADKVENDMVAKRTGAEFLEAVCGWQLESPIESQPEAYKSHDLEMQRPGHGRVLVEVERKKVWDRSGAWQGFPTVDIPHRKSQSRSDVFIMVNRHCDTLAVARMSEIKSSPVSSKDTIYTQGEQLFNVPLDRFSFYHKKGGAWTKLRTESSIVSDAVATLRRQKKNPEVSLGVSPAGQGC